jgi:hypothetical protein
MARLPPIRSASLPIGTMPRKPARPVRDRPTPTWTADRPRTRMKKRAELARKSPVPRESASDAATSWWALPLAGSHDRSTAFTAG